MLTLALAGNPNCGKTTLFNLLTGARQTVGNWPGVTVEKKSGVLEFAGQEIRVVDLPGIYSLSPYTPEERLTRQVLTSGEIDVVIDVADGTHLERNLYLTTQLMDLNIPLVLAMNLMDAVERGGGSIDCKRLSSMMKLPVVPISAAKGKGADSLLATAVGAARKPATYARLVLPKETAETEVAVATSRYDYAARLTALCAKLPRTSAVTLAADRLLTNRYLGIPIFLAVIAGIFALTFGPAGSCLENAAFLKAFPAGLAELLEALGASPWAISLAVNGILAGVGAVVKFLPRVLILFFLLSILEDTGYMARAAFLMDAPMRKLGLSGRAFVPLFMGFGCTVPAVLGTRILQREKDKRLTILISPFFSCSAKLPVYSLFVGAFFPSLGVWALMGIYLLGVVLGLLSALLFKNTVLKGESEPFLLELPDYRLPTAKTLWLHLWQRLKDFLLRAATIILGASVLLWVLQSFSTGMRLTADSDRSILAALGRLIAPVFQLCGFGDWRAAVSLMSGLAAKESVVSALAVLCPQGLQTLFTPLSAASFLVFVLLYPPCAAAISAIYKENGLKWAAISVGYQILAAWFCSALVYQWGMLLAIPH